MSENNTLGQTRQVVLFRAGRQPIIRRFADWNPGRLERSSGHGRGFRDGRPVSSRDFAKLSKASNTEHRQRMGFKLFAVHTVAAGEFNPQIISPPWLLKEQVIAEPKPVEVQLAQVGRAFAFRFKIGDLAWQVDFMQLVVSSENVNSDTAAVVAKVVEKLPHTPLTAIGNNFHYRSNLSQWQGRLPKLNDLGFDDLKTYGDVQSLGWRASVVRPDGVTVNTDVSLEPTESASPQLTVNVNYHRQVGSAPELIAAARRFAEDRKVSANVPRIAITREIRIMSTAAVPIRRCSTTVNDLWASPSLEGLGDWYEYSVSGKARYGAAAGCAI